MRTETMIRGLLTLLCGYVGTAAAQQGAATVTGCWEFDGTPFVRYGRYADGTLGADSTHLLRLDTTGAITTGRHPFVSTHLPAYALRPAPEAVRVPPSRYPQHAWTVDPRGDTVRLQWGGRYLRVAIRGDSLLEGDVRDSGLLGAAGGRDALRPVRAVRVPCDRVGDRGGERNRRTRAARRAHIVTAADIGRIADLLLGMEFPADRRYADRLVREVGIRFDVPSTFRDFALDVPRDSTPRGIGMRAAVLPASAETLAGCSQMGSGPCSVLGDALYVSLSLERVTHDRIYVVLHHSAARRMPAAPEAGRPARTFFNGGGGLFELYRDEQGRWRAVDLKRGYAS